MIQESILNSFLCCTTAGSCVSTEDNLKNTFMLDVSLFDTKLKKRIAERINDETNGAKYYDALDIELADKMAKAKPQIQDEYLDIISASPMDLSRAKILYERFAKVKSMERIA